MNIYDLLADKQYANKKVLEKLLCYKTGLSKEDLFLHPDHKISSQDLHRIQKSYIMYTQEKKPLEYILGKVYFCKLSFHVTPDTLIPRPETEYMIESVLQHLSSGQQNNTHLYDIGTGCGVLGLSVLFYASSKIKEICLSDISQNALQIARQNYNTLFQNANQQKTTIPVHFLQSNLFEHQYFHKTLFSALEENHVIVANLPYIPNQLFEKNTDECVKKREPKIAFLGGNDGLDLYRKMLNELETCIKQKNKSLQTNSTNITLFLEMMTRQKDILKNEFPHISFKTTKTFHFNIKIVRAQFGKQNK